MKVDEVHDRRWINWNANENSNQLTCTFWPGPKKGVLAHNVIVAMTDHEGIGSTLITNPFVLFPAPDTQANERRKR